MCGGRPRLAWVHIPKCGSPFATTLVNYVAQQTKHKLNWTKSTQKGWLSSVENTSWFQHAVWDHFGHGWSNHHGISSEVETGWWGHFVGMFRHPALRGQSALNHFGSGGLSESKYAESIAGSATKVMSGQMFGLRCVWRKRFGCNQQKPDVDTAVRRLAGFSFVGITDEWDLSICLFHAIFGGDCHAKEFNNKNSRNSTKLDLVHGMRFANYLDAYDWQLYSAATRRFATDLARYNVTVDNCKHHICPGTFPDDHQIPPP